MSTTEIDWKCDAGYMYSEERQINALTGLSKRKDGNVRREGIIHLKARSIAVAQVQHYTIPVLPSFSFRNFWFVTGKCSLAVFPTGGEGDVDAATLVGIEGYDWMEAGEMTIKACWPMRQGSRMTMIAHDCPDCVKFKVRLLHRDWLLLGSQPFSCCRFLPLAFMTFGSVLFSWRWEGMDLDEE